MRKALAAINANGRLPIDTVRVWPNGEWVTPADIEDPYEDKEQHPGKVAEWDGSKYVWRRLATR